jgi:hypothetical protein
MSSARESVYRPPAAKRHPPMTLISRDRLVTVHHSGAEPTGTIVALTYAKRPEDGATGLCIAVVSDKGELRRLVALHGGARPFWAEDVVDAHLAVGTRIEYSPRKAPFDSKHPHVHDDLWCGSVQSLGAKQPSEVGDLLEPLSRHALDDWWPRDVRIAGASTPRVRDGARVPSLAVVRGEILHADEIPEGRKPARATLQIGDDKLERIRVVCPEIKAALRRDPPIIGTPCLLVLGLARANLQQAKSSGAEPACEILLIGWACNPARRETDVRGKRKVQPASSDEEAKRKRAIRFGLKEELEARGAPKSGALKSVLREADSSRSSSPARGGGSCGGG